MTRIPYSVLQGALAISLTLAAILLAVTAGGRAVRVARERRDEGRSAGPRRRLVVAVADGDPDPAELDELVALDARTWRALEPAVLSMAVKLRGDARRVVVDLLERRGLVDAAVRRASRRGAVGRARAAELLGVVGGPRALVTLARLLDDRDDEVRAVAVRSLGRVSDPAAALALATGVAGRRTGRLPVHLLSHALLRIGGSAVTPLRSALADSRPEVRATATELLGLMAAVAAVDDLVDVLRGDEVVEVRVRAARALGALGSHRATSALVEATAPDEPAVLRATAAEAIGRIGSAEGAEPLAALVDEPDHWIAHHAAHALARLGPRGTAALRCLLDDGARHGARHDDARDRARGHARDALAAAGLEDRPAAAAA